MRLNRLAPALAAGATLWAAFGTGSAFAADAESLDHVRVCDVYGTGFYYIPGTETCLRVGGYLRLETGFGPLFGVDVDGDGDRDTYYTLARFQLQTDARAETEFGTFRTYANINFQEKRDAADAVQSAEIEMAMIELGGFFAGVNDSLFITQTYYAGAVSNDAIVGYGPFTTTMLGYTYTGSNGLTLAAALEGGWGEDVIDSYMPRVVIGAAYAQDWGSVTAVAGYDSVAEEWAGKLRIDLTVNDSISIWAMAGAKTDDSDPYSQFYGVWGGRWAVWGGGAAKLTDKATFNLQLGYDAQENFAAVANVAWKVVDGLTVSPEVGYYDNFDLADADALGGFVRIQADF
ncbi:porin [Mesorhizobium sp. CC13]|uniref:porin n=1 Tax=Mesorhizobium sp. CC13 TaxID=3029194 RepID=UPI00326515C6